MDYRHLVKLSASRLLDHTRLSRPLTDQGVAAHMPKLGPLPLVLYGTRFMFA